MARRQLDTCMTNTLVGGRIVDATTGAAPPGAAASVALKSCALVLKGSVRLARSSN